MSLIPAKCTQCGSNLQVDPSQEAAICPVCNTPFITQKAINNYNTTNVTNIGNLNASVVNVLDDSSRDNRVKAGETFIKLKDYESAKMIFLELSTECPYDYRGWWGLILAKTQNLTNSDISRSDLETINDWYNKAKIVMITDDVSTIENKYNRYLDDVEITFKRIEEEFKRIEEETRKKINNLEKNYSENIRTREEQFRKRKQAKTNEISILERQHKKMLGVNEKIIGFLCVVVVFISIIDAMKEGVGGFFASIVICGLIAAGAYFVIGYPVSKIFDKKAREIYWQIESCEKQLKEEQARYDAEHKAITNKYNDLKKQLHKTLFRAGKNRE